MDQKITNNSVKPQDGEQRAVGPIVHMRADSDSLLENMFNVALKTPGTEMPLQKPMRMRNLPASFFKPPNMGSKSPSCHSRENSLDSTSLQDPYSPAMNLGSPQPQQQPIHINPGHQGPQGGQAPPPPHSGSSTAIHHSRAHSSPAQLLGGAQLVTVQVPLQQQVTTQQAQQQAQQQQQQQQAQQQQLHRIMHSPHHRQVFFISLLFQMLIFGSERQHYNLFLVFTLSSDVILILNFTFWVVFCFFEYLGAK